MLADLVTFPEETLNGKLHFLCGVQFRSVTIFRSRTKAKTHIGNIKVNF